MMGARGVLRFGAGGQLFLQCPGCNQRHGIRVGEGPGPRWSWNGDYGQPTFQPSVLVQGVQPLTDDEHKRVMAGETIDPRPLVCHSFVREGHIQFLDDCTHALAGQTVPLLPIGDEE